MPAALAAVAAWVLVAHALDTYWMILPSVDRAAPRPRWTDLAAFAGVGGLAAAFVVFRLRGHAAVPLHHPHREASLRYSGS